MGALDISYTIEPKTRYGWLLAEDWNRLYPTASHLAVFRGGELWFEPRKELSDGGHH